MYKRSRRKRIRS